ncbi:MAG: RteC domain-containing protein [Gelidibacter sp.]
MKSINQVLTDYKHSLQLIEKTDLTKIKNIKAGIELSRDTILKLRALIQSPNSFAIEEDEIHFFKNIKPFVLGRLKFFGELQKFELKWPKSNVKDQKKYIETSSKYLDNFRTDNITFWYYIKNKETRKDGFYFLRSNYQVGIDGDMSQFIVDPEFTTGYDHLKAKFVAADLLSKHYKRLLLKLTNKESSLVSELILDKNRTWNGSKTDLVELIYALQAAGVLNKGQVEISKIIQFMEIIFNTNLGNAYKTFTEIKAREKDRTKFLDTLKLALLAKMDTDEAITRS